MNKRIGLVLFILLLVCGVLLFIPRNQFPFVSPISTKEFISLLPTPWVPPTLSLDSIFSENKSILSAVPSDKKWTMVATGDIIPARSVNQQTVKRNDFTWAWKNIIPLLSSGDITLINLESPLVPNCPVTVDGMVFCGSQKHMEGLLAGKVTIANFANNHMGNWGVEGIEQTRKLMEDNSIRISGLEKPAYIEVQGTKVAFLGFDDIGPFVPPVAKADEKVMEKEIFEAKNSSDVVIISMNWGVEYTDKPTERQVVLSHLAIDSGADLIIGNHPHWIQPVELYKGKVIMYAHGNTIFDQMWSEKTKEGVIGKYTFYGKELVDIEFIPIYIKDYGQPEILEGAKKKTILDQLKNMSIYPAQ